MLVKSQTKVGVPKAWLIGLAVLCAVPSLNEAVAVVWGNAHGMTGKALRDGLDFWAGGFLALHGQAAVLFEPAAYGRFLAGLYGKLPVHLWSYPPNYLLVAAGFGWLPAWPAVLAFDAASVALLVAVLRLAGQSWWLAAAVAASPASLENMLEHQNAALLTALIGGGLLVLPMRPKLGGVLIGLASIKPQLGLVLPLFLLRRAPVAFGFAVLAAVGLAGLSVLAFWGGGLGGVLACDAAGDECGVADRQAAGIRGRADQRVRGGAAVGGGGGVGGAGGGDAGGGGVGGVDQAAGAAVCRHGAGAGGAGEPVSA